VFPSKYRANAEKNRCAGGMTAWMTIAACFDQSQYVRARDCDNAGIATEGIELTRSQISHMLKNPVYVQADLDIYDFFKGHGADVVNEAADFAGTNGCYFYTGRGTFESKKAELKDHTLVIAPHERLVSSDIWLACRKKETRPQAKPAPSETTLTLKRKKIITSCMLPCTGKP